MSHRWDELKRDGATRLAVRLPSRRRVITAACGALVLLPLVTLGLNQFTSSSPLTWVLPCYLILVVGLAARGGLVVGIPSAIAATLLENFYFVQPVHTLSIAHFADVITLATFLIFSIGASVIVEVLERRSSQAERARAEAQILTKAAATVALTPADLKPVFDSLATIFDLASVALIHSASGIVLVESTRIDASGVRATSRLFSVDDDHNLLVQGGDLDGEVESLLRAFSTQLARGLAGQRAERESARLRALDEAEELRTALLRTISHDLRTPLATISANVSSLLEPDISWNQESVEEFLLGIQREVYRLTDLITNLLDAGRLEAGVVHPQLATVDLDEVLASAVETIDTQGRQLDVQLPLDLRSIETDPALLERVIANLLGNACQASPLDRPVEVRADVTPGHLNLWIVDRGVGLSSNDAIKALKPFEQLRSDDRGSGLGLTVVNGLLKTLEGDLTFSETPGGGLTVRVGLPLRTSRS